MLANCGNANPINNSQFIENQKHIVNIVLNTSNFSFNDYSLAYNTTVDSIPMFLRYYVPNRNYFGGVALPEISAFSTNVEAAIELPQYFSLNNVNHDINTIPDALTIFFNVQIDQDIIRFYNLPENGLFANSDNQYLATPIILQDNEVYIIRFKAPTFGNATQNPGTRYWSTNLGNEFTNIFSGLKDENAIIAEDGFVTIVIADGTLKIEIKHKV